MYNIEMITLVRRVNGQQCIAAPRACADPVEWMNGAREQFDNTIHAIADALAANNPGFDPRSFIALCRDGLASF